VRDSIPVLRRTDTHNSLGQGRTDGGWRVCEADKLEELVTEKGMISNVDQCAIKDYRM
jgi:hypothetical protein